MADEQMETPSIDAPLPGTLQAHMAAEGRGIDDTDDETIPSEDAETGETTEDETPDEAEQDGAAKDAKGDEDGSKLTPRLRHTAERLKMSEDDLTKMVKALGEEKVVGMLEVQAQGLDSVSGEWARLGREQRETQAAGGVADEPGSIAFDKNVVDSFAADEQAGIFEPINNAFKSLTQARAQDRAEFDAEVATMFFDALGDEYAGVYGKNLVTDTASDDPQQNARRALLETAGDIRAGARMNGRSLPLRVALQRALSQHTHGTEKSLARKAVKDSVSKRSSQVGARPSQRAAKATPGKGDDAAVEHVRQWKKEHGIT